jgi:hypothetical protein
MQVSLFPQKVADRLVASLGIMCLFLAGVM